MADAALLLKGQYGPVIWSKVSSGSLAVYSPWGHKSKTQLSNYTTTTTVLTNSLNIIVGRLCMSWDRMEARLNVFLRNFRGTPNTSGPQDGHTLPWHRSRFDMASTRSRQDTPKIKTWAILRWSNPLRLSNSSCRGKPSLSLLVWAGVGAVVAGVGKRSAFCVNLGGWWYLHR